MKHVYFQKKEIIKNLFSSHPISSHWCYFYFLENSDLVLLRGARLLFTMEKNSDFHVFIVQLVSQTNAMLFIEQLALRSILLSAEGSIVIRMLLANALA